MQIVPENIQQKHVSWREKKSKLCLATISNQEYEKTNKSDASYNISLPLVSMPVSPEIPLHASLAVADTATSFSSSQQDVHSQSNISSPRRMTAKIFSRSSFHTCTFNFNSIFYDAWLTTTSPPDNSSSALWRLHFHQQSGDIRPLQFSYSLFFSDIEIFHNLLIFNVNNKILLKAFGTMFFKCLGHASTPIGMADR